MKFKKILFMLILATTQISYAMTDQEIELKVSQVIRERHPSNPPGWWKKLGLSAPVVIISMYQKTDQILHRIRLVEGLREFTMDPQVEDFLKNELLLSKNNVLKIPLIYSYTEQQGKNSVPVIEKFLKDSDPQIRFAAAEALNKIETSSSRQALDDWKKQEQVPWVLEKFNGNSSEKNINANKASYLDYNGVWEGVWISKPENKKLSAVLTISVVENKIKKAVIKIRDGKKLERVNLLTVLPTDSGLTGKLTAIGRRQTTYTANFLTLDSDNKEILIQANGWMAEFKGTKK